MYLKNVIKKIILSFGFEVKRLQAEEHNFPDVPPFIASTYKKVRPYTMTSPERIFSLCEAVNYIVDKNIQGDIVECGVWKGGSMMAVAETLLHAGDTVINHAGLWIFWAVLENHSSCAGRVGQKKVCLLARSLKVAC